MSTNALAQARALELPPREAMLRRAPSVSRFWNEHRGLLAEAWEQWEAQSGAPSLPPPMTLLDPALRTAVEGAWTDPSTEASVRALWTEHCPGVFLAQFFDLERLAALRAYMDAVADADIPLRPPYGIALNRGGAMLDRRSEGYLAAPGFQGLYAALTQQVMRPVARLLFPEVFGYDAQTFGFSIRYEPNTDASLQPHTDASSVTLNVNMNLADEGYEGSQVDFLDPATRAVSPLVFAPGVAAIHRGPIPHATHPITAGSRSNLVLWLYGNAGQMPPRGASVQPPSAEARWTLLPEANGTYAPF
ncbi:MAG: 2OG-Fe(II) oxygenase [Myxococcota bacterium]